MMNVFKYIYAILALFFFVSFDASAFHFQRGSTQSLLGNIVAFNGDVDTAEEDVADVALTWLSSTETAATIVSSDNTDDKSGQAGARTVTVFGLDENWDWQSETATLNGTSAVTLTESWKRILGAHVATAGANGVPSGNVSIKDNGGSNTLAYILAGETTSRLGKFTAPDGPRFTYLRGIDISSENTSATTVLVEIQVREQSGAWHTIWQKMVNTNADVSEIQFPRSGLPILAKTDVKIVATSTSNDSDVWVNAQYIVD